MFKRSYSRKVQRLTKFYNDLENQSIAKTNRLGIRKNKVAGRKKPIWRRRLKNQIKVNG